MSSNNNNLNSGDWFDSDNQPRKNQIQISQIQHTLKSLFPRSKRWWMLSAGVVVAGELVISSIFQTKANAQDLADELENIPSKQPTEIIRVNQSDELDQHQEDQVNISVNPDFASQQLAALVIDREIQEAENGPQTGQLEPPAEINSIEAKVANVQPSLESSTSTESVKVNLASQSDLEKTEHINQPVGGLPPLPTITPSAHDDLYQRFAGEFGIDQTTLTLIAQCESRHNPAAANGDYAGLFQFSSSTWQSTRTSMGLDPNPEHRFNPEEAIRTAAFKIAAGGVRAWYNCAKFAQAL